MSNGDGAEELANTMIMYFAGMAKLVREEFDGSLNGTRIMLPTDAWKWMPQLIQRFGLADKVKRRYGQSTFEIPGFVFFWQDEAIGPR